MGKMRLYCNKFLALGRIEKVSFKSKVTSRFKHDTLQKNYQDFYVELERISINYIDMYINLLMRVGDIQKMFLYKRFYQKHNMSIKYLDRKCRVTFEKIKGLYFHGGPLHISSGITSPNRAFD